MLAIASGNGHREFAWQIRGASLKFKHNWDPLPRVSLHELFPSENEKDQELHNIFNPSLKNISIHNRDEFIRRTKIKTYVKFNP